MKYCILTAYSGEIPEMLAIYSKMNHEKSFQRLHLRNIKMGNIKFH